MVQKKLFFDMFFYVYMFAKRSLILVCPTSDLQKLLEIEIERLVICCCCSAYLSSCHRSASDANLLHVPHTFHYEDYFVIGGICTCLGVSDDPMFLWISSNSCPNEFAACSKPPSRDPRRQQRDQGAG